MWVYGLDWAGPGWRQVADACEYGNEPSGSVKCFLTVCKPVSCSRRILHHGVSKYMYAIYEGESNEKLKYFFKYYLLCRSGTKLYHFST